MQNYETESMIDDTPGESPGPICGCRAEARLLYLLSLDRRTQNLVLSNASGSGTSIEGFLDRMMETDAGCAGMDGPR